MVRFSSMFEDSWDRQPKVVPRCSPRVKKDERFQYSLGFFVILRVLVLIRDF